MRLPVFCHKFNLPWPLSELKVMKLGNLVFFLFIIILNLFWVMYWHNEPMIIKMPIIGKITMYNLILCFGFAVRNSI